jgi:hypothetical protein
MEAWELWSMVSVLVPGVEHHYREVDGRRTAHGFMLGGIQITISMLVNVGTVVLAGGIAAYPAARPAGRAGNGESPAHCSVGLKLACYARG